MPAATALQCTACQNNAAQNESILDGLFIRGKFTGLNEHDGVASAQAGKGTTPLERIEANEA
ncbi:hypothetical protein CTTA_4275 [Comamonas testosteroni]|uniref:Uncharacterized protein n=1 Tax=Comamonas testosteroni TaxID=285 RepID=A0A5A7MIH5_COMTE|nr:hypothetical protein CTTA_4275 [Comamonas testosteroni]